MPRISPEPVPVSSVSEDSSRTDNAASAGSPSAAFAVRVAAVTAVSYLPVLVTARTLLWVGWVTTLAMGMILGGTLRRWDLEVAIAGLLPATALISTALVQSSSQYMPAVVCGIAFGFGCAMRLAERRAPRPPAAVPRLVLIAVAAYVGWAVVASMFSTDRRVSVTYLFGMALVLGLMFVLAPWCLTTPASRRRILSVLVAIGLGSAIASYMAAALGPIAIFPGQTGEALLLELTLARHPTGLIVPWVSGLYLAQGAQYQVLVVALVALLAMRTGSEARERRWLALAAVVLVPAIVLTFSRAGWLMAAAACAIVGLVQLWRRRSDALLPGLSALFAVLVIALVTNLVGADARFDLQVARGWAPTSSAVQTAEGAQRIVGVHGNVDDTSTGSQVRGGTDLSSRTVLWYASVDAVKRRPITGYGPGLDAVAIAPFIKTSYASYRGVTSHSTWLRTAVELGVPGLVLLLLVWLAVGITALRGWLSGLALLGDSTLVALTAIVIALLIDQSVETYLLGGLTFANIIWALALGLLAWSAADVITAGVGTRGLRRAQPSLQTEPPV